MDGSAILNGNEKAKLERILDKLEFVTNENVQKYKCASCKKLALYHYFGECMHVYCGKCHGKVHQKQCTVNGCQQIISQITQDKSFENEVTQLKLYCYYKKNGCEDEMPLLHYWEHHRACPKSSSKLLPKLYKENKLQELTSANGELHKTIETLQLTVVRLEKKLSDFESNQGRTITEIKQDINGFKKISGLKMSNLEKISKTISEQLDKTTRDTEDVNIKVLQLEKQFLEFKNEQIQKNSDFQAESSNFKNAITLQMEKRKSEKEQRELENMVEDLQTKTNLLVAQIDTFKNQQDQLNLNIQTEQANFKEIVALQLEKFGLKSKTMVLTKTVDDRNSGRWRMVKQNMENIAKDEAEMLENGTEDHDERLSCKPETFMENESTEFTWKIEGIADIITFWKHGNKENFICSDAFTLKNIGRSIRAKMVPVHKSYLSVAFVHDPDNSTHQLYKHAFSVMDQSDNVIKRNFWRMTIPIFNTEAETESAEAFHKTSLCFPLKFLKDMDSIYVKHDTVLVKIIAEPIQISYNSYFSNNGKLLWKIDNFTQKKSDYIDGLNTNIFSEYFYSSESGYRMICSVGFLPKLRFFLLFVKGQNDSGLKIHFPHTTTLNILDQTRSPGQHLTKTCDSDVARYEKICDMNIDEIENEIYLNEDCLIIEVNVLPQ